jgi:hypothetical protein
MRQESALRWPHRVRTLVTDIPAAPHEGMPIVSDAAQIAGFLLAGWLLFRFTDWIYRRGSRPGTPDRATAADRKATPTDDPTAAEAIVADHGRHGPKSPAQLPGGVARH